MLGSGYDTFDVAASLPSIRINLWVAFAFSLAALVISSVTSSSVGLRGRPKSGRQKARSSLAVLLRSASILSVQLFQLQRLSPNRRQRLEGCCSHFFTLHFDFILACRKGVYIAYFSRTEAKARRARSASCARGEEREIKVLSSSPRVRLALRARGTRCCGIFFSLWFNWGMYPSHSNGLDKQSRVYSSSFTLSRVLLSEYKSELTGFTATLCNTVL